MTLVKLPILGQVNVTPDPYEPGHFLWLGHFGWHDCSSDEDKYILINY